MARNRNWSFLEAVINGAFTVPGDGAVDFAPLIDILRDHGYRGWLVVEAEQDPVVAPAYRYADKGYRHLAKLVGDAQRIARIARSVGKDAYEPARQGAARTAARSSRVTPQSAGWKYVGFAAYRLAAGESFGIDAAAATSCASSCSSGTVTVSQPAARRGAKSASARSVFDDGAPYAVYLPDGEPASSCSAHGGRDRRRQRARAAARQRRGSSSRRR